ncbi:glycoside hydrolase family 88 protein [Fibrella forsythiae]|uniref:Glycoside hydrolase family 88 protein n=1 Tax=Fibrella forsythiae TaxID=2817061 RepID=A0ABS3JN50_9BACT|nr:glycoside hydrolase family 88 protein [Fibrella forsythiae]MBO0951424.1 glycoside hydrolase family 88 protein [Fibrella forsythiae]
MIRSTTLIALLCLTRLASAQTQAPIDVKGAFAVAARQYDGMLKAHPDTTRFPQSTNPDGTPRDMKSDWWCSGFFGGSLWYLFQEAGDARWKKAAELWTAAVKKEQYNTGTHDLGFMIYCPFGNGYRLTKNESYKPVMLTAAKSLATRFDPKVGLIKSWNKFQTYNYPVIIDNMMNLELLFWAAKNGGDKRLREIAIIHADNTLKNHYRPDGSSFHVVCYNPDGTVAAKKTAQGYADESAWARGQAWGLYGYTVMYRETKDKKYLDQARRIADFYLNHPNLPADKVPYWDFNAPGIPTEERDASAAAITASALLELGTYGGPSAKTYMQAAEQMLQSLSSPTYRANPGENNHFIIKHCVGHKPAKSEVDVPLVYADYYYLEALLRYDALNKKRG